MRVFVYEFVTGGGMTGQPIGDSLANEGSLMFNALLDDLSAIRNVELISSRDARLPKPTRAIEWLEPNADEHPIDVFMRGVAAADAVWPIAPEIGGVLEGLVQLVTEAGKTLLSSRLRAVRAAASKLLTVTALGAHDIDCVPTFAAGQALPEIAGAWVIKPDDGAGGSNAFLVDDVDAARKLLETYAQHNLVAQPWLDGDALSLSLLCAEGDARLLCVNRQYVSAGSDGIALTSLFVNALRDKNDALAALGKNIAAVFTGLWGVAGVDLVMQQGRPIVLEVNPRLTTSYAGLSKALGINAAQLVLDLAAGGALPETIPNTGKPVILDW